MSDNKKIDPKIFQGIMNSFSGKPNPQQQSQKKEDPPGNKVNNDLTIIPHEDDSKGSELKKPDVKKETNEEHKVDDKIVEKLPKEAQLALKNMRTSMVEADRKREEAEAKLSQYELKIKETENKIKELEQKAPTQENVSRIAELEKKLAQYDLMYDAEFNENHIEPVKRKGSDIEATLVSLGMQQDLAQRVLKMKGKERIDELRQHIPDYAVGLIPLFAEYDRLNMSMVKAIQDESGTRKALINKRQENNEKSVEQAIYRLGDHPLLRKTQNAEYDKKIEERIAKIKSRTNEKHDTGELMVKAMMYDDYRSLYTELYRYCMKLKQDNDTLMKANPSIRTSTSGTDISKKEIPKTMTAKDVANQFARRS